MHLLGRQHLVGRDLPGIQDLTLQRHDRLEFAVARLLGGAARRVPFHEEEFGAVQILGGAVGQLARQRRPAGELFTHHFFGRTQAALGAGDRHFGQHLCGLHVLVQPQGEGIFHHPGDECRALARREALFGLAGKLRILHFDGEDVGAAIPDIFCRELHAAGQNVAVFAELTHRVQQPLAQAVNVGTAEHGRDQVNVAFGQQLAAFRQPQQRPVYRLGITSEVADKGFFRQCRQAVDRLAQVVVQPVSVAPALFGIVNQVFEGNLHARAEHRFCFQQVRQP